MEGILHALESGTSVNVTMPVSLYIVPILSEKVTCIYIYVCVIRLLLGN